LGVAAWLRRANPGITKRLIFEHAGVVATWRVMIFDARTETLVESLAVSGVDRAKVRAIWNLPPMVPIGDLPITSIELDQLNSFLAEPLQLESDRESFLGLTSDYAGESVEEADGSLWYPPPG
jgi:hypothetical protein